MVKSIYLVNIWYIGRLQCHLLISIQTLIFQPQFTKQTLILCLGDLYYEGKVKKAIFSQNFVYVLRTTPTHHMVSFIDFYFHHMFSIFTYVMLHDTHSEPASKPGLPMIHAHIYKL